MLFHVYGEQDFNSDRVNFMINKTMKVKGDKNKKTRKQLKNNNSEVSTNDHKNLSLVTIFKH